MANCNSQSLGTVAITGASGFVGRHLCQELNRSGFTVKGILRQGSQENDSCHEISYIRSLDEPEGWEAALQNCSVVIHCAGIAHKSIDALEAANDFDRVNRKATIDVAKTAKKMGVKRFVFISSVGVYGYIPQDRSASESYPCTPREPYAISKLNAENQLTEFCQNSNMELVIIRPPMIYGPYCPGNFAALTKMVKTRLPIPLGNIRSTRNYVSIFNLTHFIASVCNPESRATGIYNVADSEEVSFQETVGLISEGLSTPNRLFRLPVVLIKLAAKVVGQANAYYKLAESVRIDSTKARTELAWSPPVKPAEGVKGAAKSFL